VRVFVNGGTGYIGSRLIPVLRKQGHDVIAVCRKQSKHKLPSGCTAVEGDALDGDSYASHVRGAHTFVQLVGVSHPSPAKAKEFIAIDQRSAIEALRIAKAANVQHFVYISVAHPAPVMKVYTRVRAGCEAAICESGIPSTFLRPWYVLGPGHRWPYALIPFYAMARFFPATRDGAQRLGLCTVRDIVGALAWAVDHPQADGVRVVEVPEIRRLGKSA
jgi:uncharacterized protein YbjT (DUF2867 family)